MEEDLEDELHFPPPPEEPAPEDCCKNDCCPCVHDIYQQALQRHRTAVRMVKMRRQMKMGPHCSISVHVLNTTTTLHLSGASVPVPTFLAPVLEASVLTEEGLASGLDVRRVLFLGLGLPSGHSYGPGDYAVVRPHNDEALVHALLRRCATPPLLVCWLLTPHVQAAGQRRHGDPH
jgi:hypothetical protein